MENRNKLWFPWRLGSRCNSTLCSRRMGRKCNRRGKARISRRTNSRSRVIRHIQLSPFIVMVRTPDRSFHWCRSMPPVRAPERKILWRYRYIASSARRTADRSLPLSSSCHTIRRWKPTYLWKLCKYRAYYSEILVCPATRMGMVLQTTSPGIQVASAFQTRLWGRHLPSNAIYLSSDERPYQTAPTNGWQ